MKLRLYPEDWVKNMSAYDFIRVLKEEGAVMKDEETGEITEDNFEGWLELTEEQIEQARTEMIEALTESSDNQECF